MPRSLALALMITDWLFIAYWAASGLDKAGLVQIPADLLYANAHDPRVVAWNWSFLPLDIAFSVIGLAAVAASRRDKPVWRPLALISLILTMVAGGMAVAYWTLLGEFDPAWFLPNLALLLWPLAFLPRLIGELASEHDSGSDAV
ncbi:MAG: DUF5360 family protein [Caulobacterales bacterium]|nr:DUF5360 family protein [Caulobacterales bacterium]